MSAALAIVAGFAGGAFHLGVAAVRARLVGTGSPGGAALLAPVGMLGPLGAMAAAILWAPDVVWAVPIGLIAARLSLMSALATLLEDAWMP